MKYVSGICALITGFIIVSACNREKSDPPSVATDEVTGVSYTTATAAGVVLDDGGDAIRTRGICWSKSPAPSVVDSKTAEAGSLGIFMSELSDLSPGTKYYLRAYATNSVGTGYGQELSFSTIEAATPELTTLEVTSIEQTTAISGGTITSENGSPVVARGVCWSLAENPTTSDSKYSSGSGSGDFSGQITGLAVNTSYHVRAYATNRAGTGYGNDLVFTTSDYGLLTDIDNNSYKTIIIGSQVWMAENLKTTRYSNGDSIPYVPGDDQWSLLSDGAYCWYDNNEVNRDIYGALYNWYAGTDLRNVCPQGWHVPVDADWTVLTDFLTGKGYGYGGSGEDIAKSLAAPSGWLTNSTEGTIGNDQAANNSSGFSAVPGGVRIRSGGFAVSEYTCSMWSGSDHSYNYGNALTLAGEFVNVFRGYTFKQDGASVRCLKDE